MDLKELAVNALAQNKKASLLVGAAGAALLGFGLGYKYMRKPEKAVRVGVVSQILIYPLKSGKAVPVSVAECQRLGLKAGELQDRHWLVVTEEGNMVTARQQPRLVLVSLSCKGGYTYLNGPDMEELKFPVRQPDNQIHNCRVFSKDIQGRDCGDEASHWLTSYLGGEKTYRLVHFEPNMKPRRLSAVETPPLQFEVAYPDYGPVMLLSEASVGDLSSKLDQKVTTERFRPNLVIGDCKPFDEDSWEEIQIGNVRLQRVMSCGRCLLTTVDPETGVMSRKEPLETLKSAGIKTPPTETKEYQDKAKTFRGQEYISYRMCKPSETHIYQKSPLFGQLHNVKKTGVIHVGDEVYKITH